MFLDLRRFSTATAILGATLLLAACGSGPSSNSKPNIPSGVGGTYKVGKPYQIAGVWYYPKEDERYDATGIASWYGPQFHGKKTANGEKFDQEQLTAAHPTLPMPVLVRVTNLENGRTLVVRVNDRGPFVAGREIDLSRKAAELLPVRTPGHRACACAICRARASAWKPRYSYRRRHINRAPSLRWTTAKSA